MLIRVLSRTIVSLCFLSSCASIPEKVPQLIEASTVQLDTQNRLAVAEWENAIKAADASKKLMTLVYSFISTVDTSSLPNSDQALISNFLRGYPYVLRQLDDVLSQHAEPQNFKANNKIITDAIRLANTYIASSVDENARLEAVINSIQSIKNKDDGDN